ncbi:MAG TPA: hypothetical protein DCF70_00220 [Treponema sp.]|nr:hypothetical protein [Treponema sp.]
MRTQFEKSKVTFITRQDGTKVFYAFIDKIDYRFSDLPLWAQALPDSALLVINPEMKDGQVVLPDNIWTKKEIYSDLFWDSFHEMGRED